jgi:dTDP-4-amino-4,6-dideoxygalactose transaminase
MTRIPFLDLKAQYLTLKSDILPALEQVCESVRYAQGPPTAEFEQAFAAYCDAKHCVTLNTGTSALHLALCCLGVGPGDEVITVPMTFVATTWAISYVGAKPVFVDIDPVTRTLDTRQLEKAITPRTKAIIPVHLYGMPCDMDAILALADRHGIPVIEDACQAHGARHRGRRVGTLGQMSAFSFYPGKNLGAYGEGGALVTNNDAFAARSRRLRDHAQGQRYHHEELGFNYRMDSLQGAVLAIKLKHLEAWNDARRACAARYHQLLQGLPLVLPQTPAYAEPVWHLYVVELDNRDAVRNALGERGIETGLHYPVPVHLQAAYRQLGHHPGDFPVSEALAQRCLSLPIYAELTPGQVDAVAAALRDILGKK